MGKFILKRMLHAIPMLIFVSIVSFALVKLTPGDPVQTFATPNMSANDVARIRHNMGLDRPIHIQYFYWLQNVFKGNMGYSFVNYRPVLSQIIERLPATLGLMGMSLILAVLIGIPLGLISAFYRNKWIDYLLTIFSYTGISIPSFWFAMILIYIFSVKLHLLPSVGMHTVGVDSAWDVIQHGIMPCIVLSFHNLAAITRYIRANTISQMKENYVVTAYSLGASKQEVLYKHVLKNTMLPIITILGMSLPELVSGAFLTETVFGWPGMGQLGIRAIFGYDYPLIMAITLLSSLVLITGNMIADILYGIVDPRIKELSQS